MSRKWIPVLLIALLLWVAGCSAPAAAPEPTEAAAPTEPTEAPPVEEMEEATLTVFAASSLTDAFTELGQMFENQHPGTTVAFNFASSSDLATQLGEGAPADVFASANNTQMENAATAGRIAGDPASFLTNTLIVIVPADNPAGIETLADLATEGIRFVSALPDVPIRGFTEDMLDNAATDPAYGAVFKDAVLANLVSEEANVRQLAAKVALGEADAGVVYQSDVTPDIVDQVQMIEIPDELNVITVYPIATTNDSANPELAQAFVDLVLSDGGQAVLEKWGFGPAPEE
jgi:molybdate transport system substrate-binding protein